MANKRTFTCVTNEGNPERKQPYNKVDYGICGDLVLNFKSTGKTLIVTIQLLNYQMRLFIFQYFSICS